MSARDGQRAEPSVRYRLRIAASAHAVRHVRRIAREQTRRWGMPQLAESAGLAVSEVLTNVIRHASGVRICVVSFLRYPEGMRVEVHDECPELPVPRDGGDLAEGGRGLALLAAVTDAWDAEAAADGVGKAVWFELKAR